MCLRTWRMGRLQIWTMRAERPVTYCAAASGGSQVAQAAAQAAARSVATDVGGSHCTVHSGSSMASLASAKGQLLCLCLATAHWG
jgi:hypothetical protein